MENSNYTQFLASPLLEKFYELPFKEQMKEIEYEIEQDVIFQSKKRIFNRLEKIFQKIVAKLINEEIIQF
jgi:hypothetical protein